MNNWISEEMARLHLGRKKIGGRDKVGYTSYMESVNWTIGVVYDPTKQKHTWNITANVLDRDGNDLELGDFGAADNPVDAKAEAEKRARRLTKDYRATFETPDTYNYVVD